MPPNGIGIITSGSKQIPMIFGKEICNAIYAMDPVEAKKKMAGVITAFFQGKLPASNFASDMAKEFGIDEELAVKMMQFMHGKTSPSDAGDLMNRNRPVTAAVFYQGMVDPLLDFGFEDLFQFQDMREAGQTSFDIIDVNNAITFQPVKTGEKIKKYGITTDKLSVEKTGYGAAIGIFDDWIRYAQYWSINQAIVEARSKYYDRQAADHYSLLTSISAGQNEAFATDDITTINNACANILDDCQGLGFVITGNETFELRANVLLKERIEKAFALTFNSPATTQQNQLVFTVNRKYTTKIPATSFYVGLPGRKTQRGIWLDLSSETDRDIMTRGLDVAFYGEYNAAIGNEKQWRRCQLN